MKPESLGARLKHAWNAFNYRDKRQEYDVPHGHSYYAGKNSPVRLRGHSRVDKTIISSVYNRIAMDEASVSIVHARVDQNGKFKEIIPSGLNECLTLDANIDQTGVSFLQDPNVTNANTPKTIEFFFIFIYFVR